MPDQDDETLRAFIRALYFYYGGRPYAGILAAPLKRDRDASREARLAQAEAQWAALFEHYGIDQTSDTCWQQLATNLAMAHVPGFSLRGVQGRPRSAATGDMMLITLVGILRWTAEIAEIKTESAALRKLIEIGFTTDSFQTLRKRHVRAKKRYAEIMPRLARDAARVVAAVKYGERLDPEDFDPVRAEDFFKVQTDSQ